MKTYTVGQLAAMAGVSVRTLHHYDEIGLLPPSSRGDNGYRRYGEDDLLRLQQVLFFRELGLSLHDIARILDAPSFDQMQALEQHRQSLQRRATRLARLLDTIERTIRRLEGDDMALTDQGLYEGFQEEDVERIKREARERYGDRQVEATEQRIKDLGKAGWDALKEEMDAVTRAFVPLMGRDLGDAEVQALVARHHAVIERFYDAPAERYAGLAETYAGDPEFRAHYDRYAIGLADFLSDAMMHYAINTLTA